MTKQPQIYELEKIGELETGFISVVENSSIPFRIQRIYWTYYTPNHIERGLHAHKKLEQLIIATSGVIEFEFQNNDKESYQFTLDKPNLGLYVPPGFWRTIKFSHNAVLLCLASMPYDEDDYIRDYNEFMKFQFDE